MTTMSAILYIMRRYHMFVIADDHPRFTRISANLWSSYCYWRY